MHVLLTGMSGVGKSTLVAELRRRGYVAFDADDDGYTSAGPDGRWGWRVAEIKDLLARYEDALLFFSGCSDEQRLISFDRTILLTLPDAELLRRLRTRTTNAYGRTPEQLVLVLQDLAEIEPLLRRSADLVLDATRPVSELADAVLAAVGAQPS